MKIDLGIIRRLPVPRVALMAVIGGALAFAGAATAVAVWTTQSTAAGVPAEAGRLTPGGPASGSVAGTTVTLTWAKAAPVGGVEIQGYRIARYKGSERHEATNGCAGVRTNVQCTETGVPVGAWRYTVRPMHGDHWVGPESEKSGPVQIKAPEAAAADSTTRRIENADRDERATALPARPEEPTQVTATPGGDSTSTTTAPTTTASTTAAPTTTTDPTQPTDPPSDNEPAGGGGTGGNSDSSG